jgi:hypothetical protein
LDYHNCLYVSNLKIDNKIWTYTFNLLTAGELI